MKRPICSSKIVLSVGGILVLLVLLFPPFMEFYSTEAGPLSKATHGYHFVLTPPVSAYPKTTQGVTIETSKQFPHLIVLGILVFIVHEVVARKEKRAVSDPPAIE